MGFEKEPLLGKRDLRQHPVKIPAFQIANEKAEASSKKHKCMTGAEIHLTSKKKIKTNISLAESKRQGGKHDQELKFYLVSIMPKKYDKQ